MFKRFGLFNYTPAEVEQVVKICHDKKFVLPAVFEGSYSAFALMSENELLPVLRKHGISFYAYSPISGGFVAKTSQQFRDNALEGRWDNKGFLGLAYQFIYNKPSVLEALDKRHEIAVGEGISSVEMAYVPLGSWFSQLGISVPLSSHAIANSQTPQLPLDRPQLCPRWLAW